MRKRVYGVGKERVAASDWQWRDDDAWASGWDEEVSDDKLKLSDSRSRNESSNMTMTATSSKSFRKPKPQLSEKYKSNKKNSYRRADHDTFGLSHASSSIEEVKTAVNDINNALISVGMTIGSALEKSVIASVLEVIEEEKESTDYLLTRIIQFSNSLH